MRFSAGIILPTPVLTFAPGAVLLVLVFVPANRGWGERPGSSTQQHPVGPFVFPRWFWVAHSPMWLSVPSPVSCACGGASGPKVVGRGPLGPMQRTRDRCSITTVAICVHDSFSGGGGDRKPSPGTGCFENYVPLPRPHDREDFDDTGTSPNQ